MADKKITSMFTFTLPIATDDVIPIVDVSETDENKNKKITHNGLFTLTGGDVLANGSYMGVTIGGILSGDTLSIGQLVYIDNTSGRWELADADVAGKWPARGIVVVAGNDGQACTVMVIGILQNTAWNWSARNASLYLSDTPGAIVELASVPAGSGDCIQIVGHSLSDDEAFFNFTGTYAVRA